MKLYEIAMLHESITFSVSKEEPDEEFGSIHSQVGKMVEKECWVCNGKKIEGYYNEDKNEFYYPQNVEAMQDYEAAKKAGDEIEVIPCDYCHGTGKITEFESEGPEINLANSNGLMIVDMLGIGYGDGDDYAGTLKNEKMGEVKQRIIKMLNSKGQRQQMTRPDEVTKGEKRRHAVKKDDGTSEIKTTGGATMYSMGVSDNQAMSYLERFLELVDFAQKNGYNISWG